PQVRRWAASHVAQRAQHRETAGDAEPLLWRALKDEQAEIRQLAVGGLLTAPVTRERVVQLFERLARRPADEAADALKLLLERTADPALHDAARQALAARPGPCPECGVILPGKEI